MSEPCIQAERIVVHGMEIDAVNKDLEKHVKLFDKHVETGRAWRMAVAGTASILIIQIILAAVYFGRQAAIIESLQKNMSFIIETKLK